ncbi:MAG: hypothetical protein IPH45_07110 [Bacteroidales bacterium]|nr:hypothetical protein [Bacteroidales bacterium]
MKKTVIYYIASFLMLITGIIGSNVMAQTSEKDQQNQKIAQQKLEVEKQNQKVSQQKVEKEKQKERIEAQRVAFITDKLELTPTEAQVFWPVYNEYDKKRHELNKAFRKGHNDDKAIEELTDKEALEMADQQLTEAQKMLDLRKEYHSRFKSVLPPKKLLKLYDSEREFQKHLIDRIRDGKQQGKEKPNKPGNRNQTRN